MARFKFWLAKYRDLEVGGVEAKGISDRTVRWLAISAIAGLLLVVLILVLVYLLVAD